MAVTHCLSIKVACLHISKGQQLIAVLAAKVSLLTYLLQIPSKYRIFSL
jgi:hypothetical protein